MFNLNGTLTEAFGILTHLSGWPPRFNLTAFVQGLNRQVFCNVVLINSGLRSFLDTLARPVKWRSVVEDPGNYGTFFVDTQQVRITCAWPKFAMSCLVLKGICLLSSAYVHCVAYDHL